MSLFLSQDLSHDPSFTNEVVVHSLRPTKDKRRLKIDIEVICNHLSLLVTSYIQACNRFIAHAIPDKGKEQIRIISSHIPKEKRQKLLLTSTRRKKKNRANKTIEKDNDENNEAKETPLVRRSLRLLVKTKIHENGIDRKRNGSSYAAIISSSPNWVSQAQSRRKNSLKKMSKSKKEAILRSKRKLGDGNMINTPISHPP